MVYWNAIFVSRLKGLFTQSKFSIKSLVQVFFDKVLWSWKPASKTLSKNFDGMEAHPIFLKTLTDFDANWPIKTSLNQYLFKQKHVSLKNGNWEIQICMVEPNKLWSCKWDSFHKVFFAQIFCQKLWPSFWQKLWSCKRALTQVHKWNRNVLRINEPVKSVGSQLLFDI